MKDIVIQALSYLLSAAGIAVAGFLAQFLRKKAIVEDINKIKADADIIQQKLGIKETIADIAIHFVEQTCKDLHGKDKFDKAVEYATTLLDKNGIDITPTELEGLIETALAKAKDIFYQEYNTPPIDNITAPIKVDSVKVGSIIKDFSAELKTQKNPLTTTTVKAVATPVNDNPTNNTTK